MQNKTQYMLLTGFNLMIDKLKHLPLTIQIRYARKLYLQDPEIDQCAPITEKYDKFHNRKFNS